MNFSKLGLGRQLAENVDPLEVAQGTRDNALTGGERQHQGTANLKQKQRQQLSLNKKPMKSDTTYATEGILEQRDKVELSKKKDKESTNWRSELKKQKLTTSRQMDEAIEDNDQAMHPFVDVMPPTVKREKLMLGQGAKAAKDKKKNLEPSAPQAEAISFEAALQDLMEVTGLVDKSKPVAGTRYNRPYRTPVGEVKAMKKAQVKGNATDT